MSIFRNGGEFFNRTAAQVLPAAEKAARIGITQGSALELAHDDLATSSGPPTTLMDRTIISGAGTGHQKGEIHVQKAFVRSDCHDGSRTHESHFNRTESSGASTAVFCMQSKR
jgi:hypothetical protein